MFYQHERSYNRLPEFDYSRNGRYYITVRIKNSECLFGYIQDGRMNLNECGGIVKKQWGWLQHQYPYVILDEFIVMPDHFHGIIQIENVGTNRIVGTTLGLCLHKTDEYDYVRRTNLLSKTICAFKTTSSKLIHQSGFHDFAWQRSFYDHIIRNERELFTIRKYIKDNPTNWGSQ